MKKIIMLVVLLAMASVHSSIAQDDTKTSRVPQLLTDYYNIKNALVAGNADQAASYAAAFIKSANGIDYKIISEGNLHTLVQDAGSISDAKDIRKQREYFANLSTNMLAIVKAVTLTDQPVYQQYCPMKKAYWLSNEKSIKNPYYGTSMLTCGEITDTIE